MRKTLACSSLALLSALSFLIPSISLAQDKQTIASESPELPVHPWVVPAPNSDPAPYFVNLKDGDVVNAPFVAKFGLARRGIVAAGHQAGRAGHHHLLVNQELPLDFKKPLPFTDKYIHFGKGQTEAVLSLPPGKYDLRLVLADKAHIPYFVYSKPIHVTVAKLDKAVMPADITGVPRIGILGVEDNAQMRLPFRLQFEASGFNVSDVSAKVADTGHFRLMVEKGGQKIQTIDFRAGQTEVWLKPPTGTYSFNLEFLNNITGDKMAESSKARTVSFVQ